jgi:POT family proton-dependent oligopeptide transporter
MKSFIMSFYLLSIAGGNLFTSIINAIIQNPDGKTTKLPGASYYLFFSGIMFATAVCFIFLAVFYREPDHVKAGNKAA